MSEQKVWVEKMPENCFECPIMTDGSEGCDYCVCAILEEKAETKDRLKDCPLHPIKQHDREKDKRIKELEQKVQELQEVDNKRAFRLYAVLYDVLEKQDSENVASRIDYLTGKDYSEMCELYKTAKNLKQHDRELVKEVCEKIREYLRTQVIYCGGRATELDIMIASAGNQVLEDVKQFLDQIQKLEGEDE